ncbi:MAG TPA: SGNH/GDSL hydrolase family protein [Chitinophagaceae bacterium]|nr:SGNH/GDSL hydrolase family protein [Chitinophagaceae bacterium]
MLQKFFLNLIFVSLMTNAKAQKEPSYVFVDASELSVSGRAAAIPQKAFHRVESKYLLDLPARVAELATNSAGIYVSFKTDSKNISLKWRLEKYNTRWNMTPLAINGLDLYAWNGKKWQFMAPARASSATNEAVLINDLDGNMRHYRLYLPLYAELKTLEIGVDSLSIIDAPDQTFLPSKKVVIYGSSITQGASASRPGMAYPSILSRQLNIETFNMGFSGSGKMEIILADVLASMEADIYILDCVPNPSPAEIKERTVPFVKRLRALKPGVPIIMVESIIREQSHWSEPRGKRMSEQNAEFRKAFEKLSSEKYQDLHYIPATHLTGDDHEATIDGTHLTDLGFTRIAEIIGKTLQRLL